MTVKPFFPVNSTNLILLINNLGVPQIVFWTSNIPGVLHDVEEGIVDFNKFITQLYKKSIMPMHFVIYLANLSEVKI